MSQEVRVEGPPKCWCYADFAGERCEKDRPESKESSFCFNRCSGHGRCDRGTCVCDAGYSGVDCGVQAAGHGSPPRLVRDGPEPPPRPRLYVYDLPPPIVSWGLFTAGGVDVEFKREDGYRFIEAALRSVHRTLDPGEADYFVVPVAGARVIDRMHVLEHIRAEHPWFNASVARGAANHVLPPMADDQGLIAYVSLKPVLETLLAEHAELGLEPGVLPPSTPDVIRFTIMMQVHGLHFGAQWLPRVRGTHVPGKDIIVPPAVNNLKGCPAFEESSKWERTWHFFFYGSVEVAERWSVERGNGRLAVKQVAKDQQPDGWHFRDSREEPRTPRWDGHAKDVEPSQLTVIMKHTEYCLAPSGKDGGWGERESQALHYGCVPVYVQKGPTSRPFDELFSPPGLAFTLEDAAKMPSALRSADLAGLQREGAAACRAWTHAHTTLNAHWEDHGTDPSATKDDGVFRTILAVLARRLSPGGGERLTYTEWLDERGARLEPGALAGE